MDNQNLIKTQSIISWQRIRIILITVLPSIIFVFGNFWVKHKCSILVCEPAYWEKIQEIVANNTKSWGNQYRLDNVTAFPEISEAGIVENINYVIKYISTEREITTYKTNYPIRIVRFDNKNLWVDSSTIEVFSTSLPSSKNLEKLHNVLIEPKEAIQLTWDLANAAFGQPTTEAVLRLTFDDEELGLESIWKVTYTGNNKKKIRYWVDAQSGKIVNIE